MKIFCSLICCVLLTVCSFKAHSEQMSEIIDDIDSVIDLRCELDIESGSALQSLSNSLVSRINQRIGTILDSYNLECLSGLLSIGGIDIPGFNTNVSLNFCEIARDQILGRSGNFSSGGLKGIPASEVNAVESKILRRAQDADDLINQLKRGKSDG